MQGELCRYGNLVITSSSLHSPSRLPLPTTPTPHPVSSIWKGPLVGGRGGGRAAAAAAGKLGQSFSQIGPAPPVIRGIGIHVYFIPSVSEFAF